ncbi:MAG: putative sulfate exporter family transporter, partial [Thermodesulfobacteriota bacterium]
MAEEKRWYSGMVTTEDWWSFWIGIFFVIVGILAAASGLNLTGWMVWFPKWSNITNSLTAADPEMLSGIASLIVSYIIFSIATCIGASAMKMDVKKFFLSWTIIFWLTAILFILSRNAYIQATTIEQENFG